MRRNVFIGIWLLATLVCIWQLAQGVHDFDQAVLPGLPIMLALSLALLWWLRGPDLPPDSRERPTQRGRLLLLSLAVLLALMVVSSVQGPPLLFGIMALAVVMLLWLRQPIQRREAVYAACLAIVAAAAVLPMTGAKFPPLLWAAMQIGLVVPCLLAGWGLLRKIGLAAGAGRSLLLSDGWRAAVTGAIQGAIIGIPWALFNPLMGGSNKDSWVTQWWQPLAALQPGIAEEAWGRMLPVPLLLLLLHRYGRTSHALTAAVLIESFWFAFLHTGRSADLNTVFSTLIIGTLYALPVTYLWLRRGLETAMGFHFWQDFVRWGVAFLINTGLWFT